MQEAWAFERLAALDEAVDLHADDPSHGTSPVVFAVRPRPGIEAIFAFPVELRLWGPDAPSHGLTNVITLAPGGSVRLLAVAMKGLLDIPFWDRLDGHAGSHNRSRASLSRWLADFYAAPAFGRHLERVAAWLSMDGDREALPAHRLCSMVKVAIEVRLHRLFAALENTVAALGDGGAMLQLQAHFSSLGRTSVRAMSRLLGQARSEPERSYLIQALQQLPGPVVRLAASAHASAPSLRAAMMGRGSILDALDKAQISRPVATRVLRAAHALPSSWTASRFQENASLASCVDASRVPDSLTGWMDWDATIEVLRPVAADTTQLRRLVRWIMLPSRSSPMRRAEALQQLHADLACGNCTPAPLDRAVVARVVDAATASQRTSPSLVRRLLRACQQEMADEIASRAALLTIGRSSPLQALDWVLEASPPELRAMGHGCARLVLLDHGAAILAHGACARVCLRDVHTAMRYLARSSLLFRIEAGDGRVLGTLALGLPRAGEEGAPAIDQVTGIENAPLPDHLRKHLDEVIDRHLAQGARAMPWEGLQRRCQRLRDKHRAATEALGRSESWPRWLPG